MQWACFICLVHIGKFLKWTGLACFSFLYLSLACLFWHDTLISIFFTANALRVTISWKKWILHYHKSDVHFYSWLVCTSVVCNHIYNSIIYIGLAFYDLTASNKPSTYATKFSWNKVFSWEGRSWQHIADEI